MGDLNDFNFVISGKRGVRAALVAQTVPDPVEFAVKRLGLDPDPQQARILASKARCGILNCSRQWGKTTVTAAKVVHRAFTRAEQTILVASPSERQSSEFLKRAAAMLRRLGIQPRGDPGNPLSLLLPNGSRMVGLPDREDTVRCFTADMVVIDEAARVTDDLYHALTPMLAVRNGELWLMSTPREKRGFFFETWEFGGPKWERCRVRATDCERLPPEFLEDERARKGQARFEQEYMAEFKDLGGGLFDRDLIDAAMDAGLAPLELGLKKRGPQGGTSVLHRH